MSNEPTHPIAERLDALPVTALHLLAVALCAAGFTFDLLEMALGNALSAVFSAPPYAADPRQLSWLLASVYVGAVVGAPTLGWVADRYGRRKVLAGVLLWLGVCSLGAAATRDITGLTLMRGISGVALGAYPPLMIAYLTDLLPPARRAPLIFATVAVASLGPSAGIFLVRWLTPLEPLGLQAWRWGFIAGGVGALAVGLLFFRLPESARWLASTGRTREAWQALAMFQRSRTLLAARAPARPGPSPADAPAARSGQPGRAAALRRWSLVGVLFMLAAWSTIAFPLLTGALLTQRGFALSDTLLFVGLSTFGPFVGTLLAAQMVDRVDRRVALSACALAMAASGWCFVVADARVWLAVSSITFNVFVSLYVSVLNVYGAELFPTATRAASLSAAWAMNRIGAVAAPLVLLPLLTSHGPASMFAVIATALGLSLLLLCVMPSGRQGRAVR